MWKLIPPCKKGGSGSVHTNICRYSFYKRNKALVLLVVFVACTCFCLTFVQVDQNVIESISSDMSWFRTHRNISDFLQLGVNTCKVAPSNVKMWSDYSGNASVVYFVTSSPGNRVARHIVRNTWGSNVEPRPIFLTGYVDNVTEMNLLYDEAKLYDDIIIENFLDTYKNLTLKTGFIFKHYIPLYPNIPYFMKTDDDVLVNPDKISSIIEDILNENSGEHLPMIGEIFINSIPDRDPNSKWYLPFWLYARQYFSDYLSGAGYLVPGHSAQKILQNSVHVPLLPLEDVYFIGLVANEVSRVSLMGHKGFQHAKSKYPHYCSYRGLATVHHFEPIELLSVWMKLYRDRGTCDGFIMKIYLFLFG